MSRKNATHRRSPGNRQDRRPALHPEELPAANPPPASWPLLIATGLLSGSWIVFLVAVMLIKGGA